MGADDPASILPDAAPAFDLAIGSPPILTAPREEPFPGPMFIIPPPPSSSKLFLSGMLTLGAWHGVRAGRQIAIRALHVPEWCHDGGPVQIGHATPFDLEFRYLPLCRFDTVDDGTHPPPLRDRFECARCALHKPQCLLAALTDPRGPPFPGA